MVNGFEDLREFMAFLEEKGELVRVSQEVDPVLEINAILDRLARVQGPAVLFEKVKGSDIPLFGNAFGTWRRLSWAFGCEDFRKLVDERFASLLALISGPNKEVLLALKAQGLAAKFKNFKEALKKADWKKAVADGKTGLAMFPVEVPRHKAPCKEVVITGDDIDLTLFPLIKCWPLDGNRYATLPLIITRDPENGTLNLGIYRMMLLDKNRMCMHWLPQKHGQQHYAKAEKMDREMPVVVVIGADPALEVAGGFQLMPPLDEFAVAGAFKGSPIRYTRAEDSDLWVPAGAEIVFEGVVQPNERVDEGPFGEFHGYYSPVKKTPVFHIRKITMRRKPIWHAATTGMPPTEIHVIAKSMEGIATAVAGQFFPGVLDVNMTVESGTLYILVVSFAKKRPYEAQEVMHFMWSAAAQSPYITNIIVVDPDVNIHNMPEVFRAIALNVRPDQDLTITPRGLADLEKPSTFPRGIGARLGIDATAKWPEEGFEKAAESMDESLKKKIEKEWGNCRGLTACRVIAEGPVISIMASLKKTKPYEARDVMRFFWSLSEGTKSRVNVFVADDTVDPGDLSRFFWAIAVNMRPENDVAVSPGDFLAEKNASSFPQGMGLDATVKTPEEGLARDMPELVKMDESVIKKVQENWSRYGFR